MLALLISFGDIDNSSEFCFLLDVWREENALLGTIIFHRRGDEWSRLRNAR